MSKQHEVTRARKSRASVEREAPSIGGRLHGTLAAGGLGAPASDARGLGTQLSSLGRAAGEGGAVMRRATSSAPDADAHAVFDAATRGTGREIPFREEMERAFGHDFSTVRAYVGRDGIEDIGAEAAARGERIAFVTTSPSRDVVAHELAHVVQAREGRLPSSGMSSPGDAVEREAEQVASHVVGAGAHGASFQGLGSQVQTNTMESRSASSWAIARDPRELRQDELQSALAAAQQTPIGHESLTQLQTALGVPATGQYDEATARAVFRKQQELGLSTSGSAGRATPQLFNRLGLIHSRQSTSAGVDAAVLQDIRTAFPDGITVAFYVRYTDQSSNNREFQRMADDFASTQRAVGLTNGRIAVGVAVPISTTGEIIQFIQSIHRGLLDADRQQTTAPANAAGGPNHTRVKNLAIFSHGTSWGLGSNAGNDYRGDGVHTEGTNRPSNVDSLAGGVQGALAPNPRIQLFACSAGAEEGAGDEWTNHEQGRRSGSESVASELQQALGADATVYAHTTVGHTTENFAARGFGREAGGGEGGLHTFDLMYPEAFIQSELVRLYPEVAPAERARYHRGLREQMWNHYRDSITGEHGRPARQHRYERRMGQEMFTNPDNARTLLHQDWSTNWITSRLASIRPTR